MHLKDSGSNPSSIFILITTTSSTAKMSTREKNLEYMIKLPSTRKINK